MIQVSLLNIHHWPDVRLPRLESLKVNERGKCTAGTQSNNPLWQRLQGCDPRTELDNRKGYVYKIPFSYQLPAILELFFLRSWVQWHPLHCLLQLLDENVILLPCKGAQNNEIIFNLTH